MLVSSIEFFKHQVESADQDNLTRAFIDKKQGMFKKLDIGKRFSYNKDNIGGYPNDSCNQPYV